MALVVPETLQEKIKQNKLIPVIGAGVSMSILNKQDQHVFPSWKELLIRASLKLKAEGKNKEAIAVSAVVDMDDLFTAANFAHKGLSGSLWYDFMKEQFDLDFDDLNLDSADLHKELWKLSSRQITLNYDNCMKWAHPQSSNVLVFDNSNNTGLRDFKANTNNKDMLWHLHGNIDTPEHIILTPESYNLLYNDDKGKGVYNSALTTLRDVISTGSLLFIGCSISDVNLLIEMVNQNELFKGNTGPHYALVKESDVGQIKLKLENARLDIQLLLFSDFGSPLVEAISHISSYKNHYSEINDDITKEKEKEKEKEKDKIVIYESNPLDKPQCYDGIYKQLKKIKSAIEIKPCNVESLYESADYIFILSKWTNNGFLIEDECACSDYLSLDDLVNCLSNDIKGVIIITDNIPEDLDVKFETPIFFIKGIGCDEAIIKKLGHIYHQVFKKGNFDFFNNSLIVNKLNFDKDITLDGKVNKFYRLNSSKLHNIDKATVNCFVGRKNDLANISREISRIDNRAQILTIKGSGGVGKTTIIKKLAIELYQRGRFNDGIIFIDCESINDYEIFKSKVSYAFSLQNMDDLITYLNENYEDESRLIILDNYESILNAKGKNGKILKEQCNLLVSKITEYCTIVITSRELLCEDWEEEYTLRSLESFEALNLFNKITKNNFLRKDEQKYIKNNILEDLLDRNPLAIKLIASNLPSGVDLHVLKKDLEENIFEMENHDVFNSDSDLNINRQHSLLGSILYSYKTLTVSETRVLELISFFPDGIHIASFKNIVNKSNKNKKSLINDKDIKSLFNKSLIENESGCLRLQSIINRYAQYNARKNKSKDIDNYCLEVTKYSMGLMRLIVNLKHDHKIENNRYHEMLLHNINNVILSIEMGYDLIGDNLTVENYISFLDDFDYYICFFNILEVYHPIIKKIILKAQSDNYSYEIMRAFEMMYTSFLYCSGYHKKALDIVKKNFPLNEMGNVDANIDYNRIALQIALMIYSSEGFSIETLKVKVKNNMHKYVCHNVELIDLGIISPKLLSLSMKFKDYFQAQLTMGKEIKDELNLAINTLHPFDFLSRAELMFMRHMIDEYSLKEVNKIICFNTIASGLKSLMLARCLEIKESISIDDLDDINKYYFIAFEKLHHCKFYYVEAVYYYISFLKECNNVDEYLKYYKIGYEIANECSFRYLSYKFMKLTNPELESFDYMDTSLIDDIDHQQYIENQYKFLSSRTGK